jgi:hypothetical protein
MSGRLITETSLEQIPDAAGRGWDVLEREYPLLRQEGNYGQKIFNVG